MPKPQIQLKKCEQEQDIEFWEMINDREGELYKQYHGRLNSFERDIKTGKGFEIIMRKAFDEIMLERDKRRLSGDNGN